MRVEKIPVLEDNFTYILIDEDTHAAVIVDPSLAQPIINFLKKNHLTCISVFNTHHHSDHVGGNKGLIAEYPDAKVYGGFHDKGRIPHQTVFLNHNDVVTFAGEESYIYYVPGHTLGHICYHFKLKNGEHYLFIGDTLFSGGCGKII